MGDPVAQAAALHRQASIHFDRGRLDLAHRTLATALNKLDQPDYASDDRVQRLLVRVLVTLYNVEAELRGTPYRHDHLERAETIATRIGAADLAFTVDNAQGLRAMRDGDVEVAVRHFSDAEDHIAAAPARDAGILLLNRGTLRLQQLSLIQARDDFNRCLALVEGAASASPERAAPDAALTQLAFMARHNLGYTEFLFGNLPAALRAMDSAARMPVEEMHGICHLDKARVLIAAGLIDAADRSLQLAAEEFRRGRLHQELAEAELARAECAMLALNPKSARALAGSARTRLKRRSNDRWRRIAELLLLQADLADGRPPARLVGPATRLEHEFHQFGLEQQARTAGLVACAALAASGNTEQAGERLAAINAMETTDPITLRLHQRAVAAEIAVRTADRPAATAQIRRGLRELTRHQAQFGSIDLQTASAVHGRRLMELNLQNALASHRPDAVFTAIERGRAISGRLAPVTPPPDESREPLAEMRQLTEILRTIGDDPDAIQVAQGLRERTRTLHAKLGSISWRLHGGERSHQPATLAAVRHEVESRRHTLVTFCSLGQSWSAVVIGEGRPRLATLPDAAHTPELVRRAQADLNVLALPALPPTMRNAVTASLQRTMQRLDDTLLRPLALSAQPLVIVPTGVLATLAWNCLPSVRGRPLVVSPTATRWLENVEALTTAPSRLWVDTFAGPGLQMADAEAETVARIWRASGTAQQVNASAGASATAQQLAAALRSSDVVHVAAHGSHERQNPMFSSLQLSGGPLFAYEIAPDDMAPHVILSACELGQNTIRPGDETLGLTSVLLHLGARCVIAGVAQVGDTLAGQVMADYHRRLAGGTAAAHALAEAVESVDQPYVPFICFGGSWYTGEPGPRR